MKPFGVDEIIALAKEKSPFYSALYKDINLNHYGLEQLPIVDETLYSQANSFNDNKVKTCSSAHCIALRSGGTTAKPKTALFTVQEWKMLGYITMNKLCQEGLLRDNDVVANLFASGNMYGALLLIHGMLMDSSLSLIQLPIGTTSINNVKNIHSIIREFNATCLISMPLSLVGIGQAVKKASIGNLKVERMLYGGDLMLSSQLKYLKKILPNVVVTSSGYASTDSGFLGYVDASCAINEYRSDPSYTILEIVDKDTGAVIVSENKVGRLIATNLTRSLTPVIRYPVGDLAMWLEGSEAQNRKFRLCGRDSKQDDVIITPDKKYTYVEIYRWLAEAKYFEDILGFEIILERKKLSYLQVAVDKELQNEKVRAEFESSVNQCISCLNLQKIVGKYLKVKLIDITDLKFNSRTYKAIKVLNTE